MRRLLCILVLAGAAVGQSTTPQINHFIMIVKENRSFDHMFGHLPGVAGYPVTALPHYGYDCPNGGGINGTCANGPSQGTACSTGAPATACGTGYTCLRPTASSCSITLTEQSPVINDPGETHEHSDAMTDIRPVCVGGANNGNRCYSQAANYCGTGVCTPQMDGFLYNTDVPYCPLPCVYTYYGPNDIPNYYQLATHYGIADNFFSSLLSGSAPNHFYFVGGQGEIGSNPPVSGSAGNATFWTVLSQGVGNVTPTGGSCSSGSTNPYAPCWHDSDCPSGACSVGACTGAYAFTCTSDSDCTQQYSPQNPITQVTGDGTTATVQCTVAGCGTGLANGNTVALGNIITNGSSSPFNGTYTATYTSGASTFTVPSTYAGHGHSGYFVIINSGSCQHTNIPVVYNINGAMADIKVSGAPGNMYSAGIYGGVCNGTTNVGNYCNTDTGCDGVNTNTCSNGQGSCTVASWTLSGTTVTMTCASGQTEPFATGNTVRFVGFSSGNGLCYNGTNGVITGTTSSPPTFSLTTACSGGSGTEGSPAVAEQGLGRQTCSCPQYNISSVCIGSGCTPSNNPSGSTQAAGVGVLSTSTAAGGPDGSAATVGSGIFGGPYSPAPGGSFVGTVLSKGTGYFTIAPSVWSGLNLPATPLDTIAEFGACSTTAGTDGSQCQVSRTLGGSIGSVGANVNTIGDVMTAAGVSHSWFCPPLNGTGYQWCLGAYTPDYFSTESHNQKQLGDLFNELQQNNVCGSYNPATGQFQYSTVSFASRSDVMDGACGWPSSVQGQTIVVPDGTAPGVPLTTTIVGCSDFPPQCNGSSALIVSPGFTNTVTNPGVPVYAALPQVSWVIPTTNVSEHPSTQVNMQTGEAWTMGIVNAFMQSQYYSSSLLCIMWDDFGGFPDHVPPPTIDNLGFGERVPIICVGPYVKNTVNHALMEPASWLKCIESTFSLPTVGGGTWPNTTRDGNPNITNLCGAGGMIDLTQAPIPPFANIPNAPSFAKMMELEKIKPKRKYSGPEDVAGGVAWALNRWNHKGKVADKDEKEAKNFTPQLNVVHCPKDYSIVHAHRQLTGEALDVCAAKIDGEWNVLAIGEQPGDDEREEKGGTR